ncbi:MAG: hypothetical protein QXM93_03075 [Candidatus Methanomethyliaceae archaeon]
MVNPQKGLGYIIITFIILVVIIPVFIPLIFEQMSPDVVQIEGAKRISNILKALPLIDLENITSSLELIQRINSVIEEINQALKADFPKINSDEATFHQIQEFIPLVEPYNNLILSARNFNETDPGSVKQIYMDSYYFASSVVIIEGKFAYRIAYGATGFLNNLLKLHKLRGICGNECYSYVLSKIHSFIRNYSTELEKEFQDILNQLL